MIRAKDVSRRRSNASRDSAGELDCHSRHVKSVHKGKLHVGRAVRVDRLSPAGLPREPSPGFDQGVSARLCRRPRRTLQIFRAHRTWTQELIMNPPTSSLCRQARCLLWWTTKTRPVLQGRTLGRGRRYRSDRRPRGHPMQHLGHCLECSLPERNLRSPRRGGPVGRLIKNPPVCIFNTVTEGMH
jgi:hypothetical protein